MVPSVLYPSYALQSVVARYEYYDFTNAHPNGGELSFAPGIINDFLFSSGTKLPRLVSSCKRKSVTLPAGALLSRVKSQMFIRFSINSSVFRVVFHPGAVSALYQVSINKFKGLSIELGSKVNGKLVVIQQKIEGSKCFKEKVKVIEAHLSNLLVGLNTNSFLYPRLNSFLLKNGYDVSAEQLSSLFYRCPRHFNRLLKAELGLSMQDFVALHRITRVLKYLLRNPGCRLIKVAYDFDFSDQSHFSNNFRRIMGVSPKKYMLQQKERKLQPNYDLGDHAFGTGVILSQRVKITN